jgi:hypothetical protein
MRKIILSICTLICGLEASSQITTKDSVSGIIPINATGYVLDTLFNTGTSDVSVEWLVSPSSVVASGHSPVGICFLPGACYAFDNSVRNDVVTKGTASLYQLDWKIEPTAVQGSTSYVVVTTDISGGKDIVFKVVAGAPLSITELENSKVNVYPLPANDVLNIEMPNINASKLEIVNLSGASVLSLNNLNSNPTKVNIQDLSAGLYFLNIYNAENKIIARKKISK